MTADVLPFNLEAEELVVGACLMSKRAIETASEILTPAQMHSTELRNIYGIALTLHSADIPVDPVIVYDEMPEVPLARLQELMANTSAAGNVAHHARIVVEHATRRDLIRVGQEIARAGWEPNKPLQDELAAAEQLVYDLTTAQEPGELRPIADTLPETFATLDRPGGEITGTPTGLRDLDRLTAGLQPGNLVIVAARPGMGKSALALNACHNAAVGHDNPVALFTLEMGSQEINQRILSIDASVPLMRLRTRVGLTGDDRAALQRSRERLDAAPLHVDDTVSARVIDIRARTRRLKARLPNLALVVVDYIQLMLSDARDETRNLEVARISRGLKLLARELDVPVMALAQLNRQVEQRHDKRPILSDLRDSGALEQDADLVIFIHRDPEQEGTADLTVAKHRNGPTGNVPVAWIKQRASFATLAEEPV